MKNLSVSALALAVALAASPVVANAAETTPGWYVGAGAGVNFGSDGRIQTNANTVEDQNFAPGADFLGNVGYGWMNGIRVEGEYFHNQTNLKNAASYQGVSGHVINNALFANAFYDFQNDSLFTPYIGAGVGPDFIDVHNLGASGLGHQTGNDLEFGYQGIAGVSAQLDPHWSVSADYRYIGSFDPTTGTRNGNQGRVENQSSNILFGVRYSFDTPEAPVAAAPVHTAMAPVVAPHAAAKPMVAPVPQNFMVFFDFNKATLTPEAKRIIASAAQEFKRGNFVKITVTGHTDTVGSAGYNKKLSDERAAAVKAELNKLGVPGDSVSETGVGKDGLMVPTADGVREAQNRRAEIVLSK